MVWGCITYHGVGAVTRAEGNTNSEKYIEIIDNNLWSVILTTAKFFRMIMPLFIVLELLNPSWKTTVSI
jgi:hypothetical protein